MEMQQYQVFFCLSLLGLLLRLRTCRAIDFCDIPSCQEKTHIGCNNSLIFNVDKCLRFNGLVNMQSFRQYLLTEHNKYRQDVASGRLNHLPTAQKMPELVWDDYLALLAEYHLKSCQMHLPTNSCVATDDFPQPRSNYGEDFFPRPHKRQSNVRPLTGLIEEWMDEIYELQALDSEMAGDNIANIITDRCTHMGCAAGQDYDLWNVHFALVCYYSAGPPPHGTLYEPGSFNVSLCAHGKSQGYPNLCKTLPLNH
ncbi:antigen 5 like allergen Cul n 1 [Drosophila kikkawai]|uniref:Antigen 5 like allergen Cul n 1 n=1 Tax=Drosophila kikkawai TaxID=30033 RepID=A0A6P4HPY8_DROKI|nr:antigen 5 like allergen Cul n 1 [Drosophila kikkawai]